MDYKLTFLYDGACPLCLRETNFLKSKDKLNLIKFVDISAFYNPKEYKNITYQKAMSNLHGILNTGEIILGVDVLAYSYELIGLGWVYFPTKLPIFSSLIKFAYKYWAKYRLNLTGRGDLKIICQSDCYLD
tara:strand:- start:1564 stop:1956 length:393 start_codon:yes stop_codon:yes gene_type:complete